MSNTIINIYSLNIRASKYNKQILIDQKGKTDKNRIIVGQGSPTLGLYRLVPVCGLLGTGPHSGR